MQLLDIGHAITYLKILYYTTIIDPFHLQFELAYHTNSKPTKRVSNMF